MDEKFDIQAYLARGVENIVSGALRATLKDPRESAFMVRFAAASRRASQRRAEADQRRGAGIYDTQIANMDALHEKGLLFGASVTVTTQNVDEAVSPGFIDALADRGCKLVIYVEYVPVTAESQELAPGEPERILLRDGIARLREQYPEVVFVSFPGDEKSSGGCIAAGRGFFHINSHGGAEPCPFSPYSDVNVRDTSLRQALASPLFTALREGELLADDHAGGCVLFEKRADVEALLTR